MYIQMTLGNVIA